MKDKKEWNGTCMCKHKHSEHSNTPLNMNYTAGKCKKCSCKGFNHDIKTI